MVYRIYVEKKKEFAREAAGLLSEAAAFLGVSGITGVRVINRYDCEGISGELFEKCVSTVFSEPQVDTVYRELPEFSGRVFAVEYLPGQYDQRADSASQCIQIISKGERPAVRTAKIYVIEGDVSDGDAEKIKKYVINPVESREASLGTFDTLEVKCDIPERVETVDGFISMSDDELEKLRGSLGLAMDHGDIVFCRDYFVSEKRDPTITEIRMIDTYWSDHCRHTTFHTEIDSIEFEDGRVRAAYDRYIALREKLGIKKPVCLMDMGVIGAKALRADGRLDRLDISDEINACTVKIDVEKDGKREKWLMLFKNETHNHPTEIEPFGGAATCIGGAIRDPLSGRAYVYGAMRVTGAADPTVPVSETMKGKLPQRKLTTTAAAGYSSYGNQIGLATGQVDELYHPGYAAKRMEIGAVIAAVPAKNVRRECPAPGDTVILLGGRTGRDGCGGATGSSKAHDVSSIENCGAEVQKGNAPEERKLQRLFRNPEASLMIKRCNDFGAGGVSVAIGELADGISVDLNAVPKKYEGLDGTELAISESQERMAVVVAPEDAERFMELARMENLEATAVASVTSVPRLRMRWNGADIVDISREFLDSNGAPKHTDVRCPGSEGLRLREGKTAPLGELLSRTASDLNVCSKRGLSERFDSTIGAGTVLMPFGGKYQRTPSQAMVNKISLEHGDTETVSMMAWGFNPYISEESPYCGAYLAVFESVAKLIASGAQYKDIYLTFQEYFEKPMHDPKRWGKPVAAVLGALSAQLDLGIAAIGGKDSMSGSFEDLDVPPTLVSFAVTVSDISRVTSPEFKKAGSRVWLFCPDYDEEGIPEAGSFIDVCRTVSDLTAEGGALSVCTPGMGGLAAAVMKMTMGNAVGFEFDPSADRSLLAGYLYGSFIVETGEDACFENAILLGRTVEDRSVSFGKERVPFDDFCPGYESRLESVFPCNDVPPCAKTENFTFRCGKRTGPAVSSSKVRVLIPVFPGTNCEYDSVRAIERAGAEAEVAVIRNLSPSDISESVDYFAKRISEAQAIMIPGGFSGGDEPDGSGKFIAAFFRSDAVREAVSGLLDRRDGLMLGICNGFQALIKLGLVPFGRITDMDADCPTLTYNTIGRHQSKIVRTRIASDLSPWLMLADPDTVYSVPISHGEGNFIADDGLVRKLARAGQIATQYVDEHGNVSGDIDSNPNGSLYGIEGITSPDGRIFGKMGHSERWGRGLYRNVPGNYDMKLFESMVRYYSV